MKSPLLELWRTGSGSGGIVSAAINFGPGDVAPIAFGGTGRARASVPASAASPPSVTPLRKLRHRWPWLNAVAAWIGGRVSWEFYMEKFVERRNIARFTTLLMTETDTAKRELLQKLLNRRNGKAG